MNTKRKLCTCPGGPGSCGYWSGKECTHMGHALLNLTIRLERKDDMPAFAAFLRCEPPSKDNHVMYLNVQACMSPMDEDEHGNDVPTARDDRIRTIISSLMHEFGHALESQFGLPVNEDAIEKTCEEWESAFAGEEVERLVDGDGSSELEALDDAINHCRDIVSRSCGKCKEDHEQLMTWLADYKRLFAALSNTTPYLSRDVNVPVEKLEAGKEYDMTVRVRIREILPHSVLAERPNGEHFGYIHKQEEGFTFRKAGE